MPDTRKHRGPHPADAELFAPEWWPVLQQAVTHLSWLLSREYAWASALKLVGDRFQLAERQRLAVLRSSCSDAALARRTQTRVKLQSLDGSAVAIDGFNLLTTIEAALSAGVIIRGRDGCDRDMASMHGSYRKVAETAPAVRLIGDFLAGYGVQSCRWYFDRPVSNSGRISVLVQDIAAEKGWRWEAELIADPDPVLATAEEIVVSADSAVLDRCGRWCNLAREVVEQRIPDAFVVPMAEDAVGQIFNLPLSRS